jgi:hypothetical protein
VSEILQLPYDIDLIKETCAKIQEIDYDLEDAVLPGSPQRKVLKWILGSLKHLTRLERKTMIMGLGFPENEQFEKDILKIAIQSKDSLKHNSCSYGMISGDDLAGFVFPKVKKYWIYIIDEYREASIIELHYQFPNLELLVIVPCFFNIMLDASIASGLVANAEELILLHKNTASNLTHVPNEDFPNAYDAEVRSSAQKILKTKVPKLPSLEIQIFQ